MMDKILLSLVSEYFMYVTGLAICIGLLNLVYGLCTTRPRRR